jgi:WD40 repeat protein
MLVGANALHREQTPFGQRVLRRNFCLSWSRDSQHLASGGMDKALTVYAISRDHEARHGRFPQLYATLANWRQSMSTVTLRGHTDWVTSAAFNSDGTLLASASRDATAKVWSTRHFRLLHTLVGHTGPIRSVSWSRGPYERLFTASEDSSVRTWDATKGTLCGVFWGHAEGVLSVTCAASGGVGMYASSAFDQSVLLWSNEVRMCVCMRICVCRRQREREKLKGAHTAHTYTLMHIHTH